MLTPFAHNADGFLDAFLGLNRFITAHVFAVEHAVSLDELERGWQIIGDELSHLRSLGGLFLNGKENIGTDAIQTGDFLRQVGIADITAFGTHIIEELCACFKHFIGIRIASILLQFAQILMRALRCTLLMGRARLRFARQIKPFSHDANDFSQKQAHANDDDPYHPA